MIFCRGEGGGKRVVILGCLQVLISGELDSLECNPENVIQNFEYIILLQSIPARIHPLYLVKLKRKLIVNSLPRSTWLCIWPSLSSPDKSTQSHECRRTDDAWQCFPWARSWQMISKHWWNHESTYVNNSNFISESTVKLTAEHFIMLNPQAVVASSTYGVLPCYFLSLFLKLSCFPQNLMQLSHFQQETKSNFIETQSNLCGTRLAQ